MFLFDTLSFVKYVLFKVVEVSVCMCIEITQIISASVSLCTTPPSKFYSLQYNFNPICLNCVIY